MFHEGLKSWSCCSDVNKPELSFDEFMKIQGCQTGVHIEEAPKPPKPVAKESASPSFQAVQKRETTASGPATVETFSSGASTPKLSKPTLPPPPPPVEEEDDLTITPEPGKKCRNKGCNAEFINNEESRLQDGENSTCVYHPSQPIFHEGSKGYLCCKRRVLEFDEFLKITGCKTGKHVFVPKKTAEQAETVTTCRIDHYQTPKNVCVSVFAKKTDKERSSVTFDENHVYLDLFFQDSKRFERTLTLFGPIIPTESNFSILGTKVELNLVKKDNRSWNLLEQSNYDLGGFNLTFGVGGRTGTIGAQKPILDESNMSAKLGQVALD